MNAKPLKVFQSRIMYDLVFIFKKSLLVSPERIHCKWKVGSTAWTRCMDGCGGDFVASVACSKEGMSAFWCTKEGASRMAMWISRYV